MLYDIGVEGIKTSLRGKKQQN